MRVVQFKMTLGLPFKNEATHRKNVYTKHNFNFYLISMQKRNLTSWRNSKYDVITNVFQTAEPEKNGRHNNASAHKAKVTTTFLSEQGIQVLDHPP